MALHADFGYTDSDAITPDFVLAYDGIANYGEDAISSEEILSDETRALLNEICADVELELDNLTGGLGDYAADLDEILP